MSNLKGIEKLKDLEIENLEGLQIEKKTELVREIAIEYLEKLERPELITQIINILCIKLLAKF